MQAGRQTRRGENKVLMVGSDEAGVAHEKGQVWGHTKKGTYCTMLRKKLRKKKCD
jgi:hypothetical protein